MKHYIDTIPKITQNGDVTLVSFDEGELTLALTKHAAFALEAMLHRHKEKPSDQAVAEIIDMPNARP